MAKPRNWDRISKLLRMCGSASDPEALAGLKALQKEVGSWSEWCSELLDRQAGQATPGAHGSPIFGMNEYDSELVTTELLNRLRSERASRQSAMRELYQKSSLNGGCHFDPTFKRTNRR